MAQGTVSQISGVICATIQIQDSWFLYLLLHILGRATTLVI